MDWPADIDASLKKREAAIVAARVVFGTPADEYSFDNMVWSGELVGRFEAKKKVIYVIEELGGDPRETFDAFQRYKTSPDAHRMPRANAPSQILYVGSSKSVKSRLKQHLEASYKGTYALNFGHWFGDRLFRVSLREYNVSQDILQLMEDSLSEDLCPAFGKAGSNGR